MKNERLKKQLQSQINNLTADREALKTEISIKQSESKRKAEEINKLKAQIENLSKDKTLKVSEHAIVRYFERVKGFNIEEIQSSILNQNIRGLVSVLGDGSFPHPDGYNVVFKDSTVVTIL